MSPFILGLLLILIGLSFMIAETYVISFGILGVSGIVAFIYGAVMLVEYWQVSGPLSWSLIAAMSVVFAAALTGFTFLALRTLKRLKRDTDHDLKTKDVKIVSVHASGHEGQVEILGEIWKFTSEQALTRHDRVEVLQRQGLTLKIKKKE